jgi:hypothetical protein
MTRRLTSSKLSVVALVVAVIVVAATVEHAIRTNSLSPIWMIGWLPGVLLAFYQPGSGRRCADRIPPRSGASGERDAAE